MDQARIGHEALPLARPSAASERELAFGAFVERALPQNYRLARAILGDPAEAEDATHDAFELAWKRWDTLRDPDLLDAWFGRIDGTGAGTLFIYDEQWGRVLVFLKTDGSYLEQWATRGPQPPMEDVRGMDVTLRGSTRHLRTPVVTWATPNGIYRSTLTQAEAVLDS